MAEDGILGGGLGFCSWTRRSMSGLLIAMGLEWWWWMIGGPRHGRACFWMTDLAQFSQEKWGIILTCEAF
jgi:hypothetical protein